MYKLTSDRQRGTGFYTVSPQWEARGSAPQLSALYSQASRNHTLLR